MGMMEEAKGKLKQAAGDLTDNPEMRQEGRAQEDKAVEERRENQAAVEAQQHEEKAQRLEREQEAAERNS